MKTRYVNSPYLVNCPFPANSIAFNFLLQKFSLFAGLHNFKDPTRSSVRCILANFCNGGICRQIDKYHAVKSLFMVELSAKSGNASFVEKLFCFNLLTLVRESVIASKLLDLRQELKQILKRQFLPPNGWEDSLLTHFVPAAR